MLSKRGLSRKSLDLTEPVEREEQLKQEMEMMDRQGVGADGAAKSRPLTKQSERSIAAMARTKEAYDTWHCWQPPDGFLCLCSGRLMAYCLRQTLKWLPFDCDVFDHVCGLIHQCCEQAIMSRGNVGEDEFFMVFKVCRVLRVFDGVQSLPGLG